MKAKQLLSICLLGATALFSLESCDPYFDHIHIASQTTNSDYAMDKDQSMAISGQWTGDFGAMYYYTSRGQEYRYDSYDTDVVFYPEYTGATRGWGKEVDFYDYGPYQYIYHKFNWELRNGILYLTYIDDSYMNCWIRDYRMTNDYFTGYFGSSDSSFTLRKISDYYNWTPYVNTYSYGERRDWYANSRQDLDATTDSIATDSLDATTDSLNAHTDKPQLKFGNRNMK